MKVALLHFHLKTGGVTTVIEQQAKALAEAGDEVLVLSGEPAERSFSAPVAVIPGMGYDHGQDQPSKAVQIAKAILHAVNSRWPTGPDVIHVHNPTLAKNRQLQAALKSLQSEGMNLLCQIHDFAEDGRPDAYFQEDYVPDCHYAVLNDRDLRLMLIAGLNAQGVHYLPNPVSPPDIQADDTENRIRPVLYPIRAIRRKNIGEAILLSSFFPENVPLDITLPPNSPKDFVSYDHWRNVVSGLGLSARFEAGLKQPFSELVSQCAYVLTTSVTEGFGFTFLEPWAAGKALWGRLLPDICQDFTARGVRLDHLYTQVRIPLKWTEVHRLRQKWCDARWAAAGKFNTPLTDRQIDEGWQAISTDNAIDFGLLDESFQTAVILKVLRDSDASNTIKAMNPFLSNPGPPDDSRALINHNSAAVRQHYHPIGYAKRLRHIYAEAAASPVHHAIDKKVLLTQFMSPHRFSLLKWSPFDG